MEYLKAPKFENSDLDSKNLQYELGEHISQIQNKVAVYNGKATTPVFPSGTLYLTSHRICYIPDFNTDSSFQLHLSQVINLESQAGTFTASSKIKITFDPTFEAEVTERWTCSSCSFINQGSSCLQCNASRFSKNDKTSLSCEACTFDNHPSLINCEICGTPLPKSSSSKNDKPDFNFESNNDLPMFRLSFRGGGQSSSLSALKAAIDGGLWKKSLPTSSGGSMPPQNKSTIGGIDSLVRQVENSNLLTNQELGAAFEDIQALMNRAAPMVKLATTLAAKLQKLSSTSKPEELTDTDTLVKSYLVQLGIDSPITKDAAGSMFHLELAKELGKVIVPIISKLPYLNTIDLMDVFCLFNRARGVGNFISPADLVKSCDLLEKANVPLSIKRFSSGVTILQSKGEGDTMVDRIVAELDSDSNGLDLASLAYRLGTNISIEMLKVHLDDAEAFGKICRDGSTSVDLFDSLDRVGLMNDLLLIASSYKSIRNKH